MLPGFEEEDYQRFDMAEYDNSGGFPPDSDLGPGCHDDDDDDDSVIGIQHMQYMPKNRGMSRPAANFSGRHSTTGNNFNHSAAFAPPRSQLSDTTSRSSLPYQMTAPFLHKPFNPPPPPSMHVEAIAALSDTELLHNPQHRRLRREHDRLSSVLAMYMERDLVESRSMKGKPLVPELYPGVSYFTSEPWESLTYPPAAIPRCMDSRTPSLGPSDSASHLTRSEQTTDQTIQQLLESVEPPPVRPQVLPQTVLWDYEDCESDRSEGVIVTEANKRRPRMNLAIRRPDGKKVSSLEFSNIRRSADFIIQKLINLASSDPRSAAHTGSSKPWTKKFLKNTFTAEYCQAILDLEAEQKLLRLCSAHWKADAMIGQAFSRRSEAEARAARSTSIQMNPFDDHQPPDPSALLSQNKEVAFANKAKRSLEWSPGPKSPSASQAHKRSNTGQKNTGSRGPSNRKFFYSTAFEPTDT